MKKNLVLTAFALIAIASTLMFLDPAFASSVSSDDARAASPAVSTTLVISQVYPGGGSTSATVTYKKDYVEIKNVSGSPQPIAGLTLQYSSALGTFGTSTNTLYALTGTTILQPGQYYLVELGALGMPTPGGADLPVTADESTTNLSMSATSGKVALSNSSTPLACGSAAVPCTFPNPSIIDWVAWGAAGNGTAGNGEGGTSVNNGAPLPANTNGAVRKNGGCTDTDNNNLDFDVIVNPVPRNSASPAVPCGPAVTLQHVVDYNGDGKTDYAVVRNTGGGPSGQNTWYISTDNGSTSSSTQWGIASDFIVSGDFDGDTKSDITVWRPAPAGSAAFYVLRSTTNTLLADNFGQTGDDPTVVGDYTGDGRTDFAVYREGAIGVQSYWYYRASSGPFVGGIVYEQWGAGGDDPAPGDFNGDGKYDFMIQRNNGGNSAIFWQRLNGPDTVSIFVFGTAGDLIVPGDYDGDLKTDIMLARVNGNGNIEWYLRASSNPDSGNWPLFTTFGVTTDVPAQGDYDSDGKTDVAVWRPSATATQGAFIVRSTATGNVTTVPFGQPGDFPVARFNGH